MTLVKFSDTYIIISFNKRELNVDVKLDKCDGVYRDDNSHLQLIIFYEFIQILFVNHSKIVNSAKDYFSC